MLLQAYMNSSRKTLNTVDGKHIHHGMFGAVCAIIGLVVANKNIDIGELMIITGLLLAEHDIDDKEIWWSDLIQGTQD